MPTEDASYELKRAGLDDLDKSYWFGELRRRGLSLAQIDTLLETPGASFHELCSTLDAGCPVDIAFDIYS